MTKTLPSLPYSTQTAGFHLILKVLLLELFLAGFYITAKYTLEQLNSLFSLNLSAFGMSTTLFVFFSFFQICMLLFIFLQWITTVYEVTHSEAIYRVGILSKKVRAYDMSNVQSAYFEQSLLGRIFNYGNVTLYSPALKEDLQFFNVPSPLVFKQSVDLALQGQDENNSTYLRRFS